VFGYSPTAYAQDEFTLEEITVTAQKREQELQKVATTVEVIQGYELTEMGHVDLDEALRNVSNALVQPVGEDMTVIIRGMDNDEMPGNSFSQVAVTIDGSFSNNWRVGTAGLYDMQRIEVLAGPQGTLYSRNSSGGVVNMISNDPKTEDFAASGSLEMGNYSLVNTQGMINVPISDSWAVRAAFIDTVHDGYADNGLNDADDRSMRLKLGYASDTLSAVLTYEFTKWAGKGQADGYAQFEDEDDVDDPWHSDSDPDMFVSNTQTDRFYMNLDWVTPIGTVTFLPSYSDTMQDMIAGGFMFSNGDAGLGTRDPTAYKVGQLRTHLVSPQEEYSYELRMASNEDFFMDWLIGLYYYDREWWDKIFIEDAVWDMDDDDDTTNIIYHGTEDTASFGMRGSTSKAAFGNFTYPVTDTLRFVGGGRYTKEEEKSAGGRGGPPPGGGATAEQEPYHFDYKLAVEYDLSADTMIWLDHSTGYKIVRGGTADQKLNSFQAGIKNRLLDNKLQMNANAFYYDYSNFDIGMRGVSKSLYDDEGNEYRYNAQGIADSILYGFDFSSDWLITNEDRFNFSLSYLKAEVDQVEISYMYFGEETPEFPREYVDAGKPLNNAPELSIVAGYEHRFDLASGSAITPRISARFTSKYYLQFYPEESNTPPELDVNKVNTEPDHIMADVSLLYNHHSGKWTLNGYVKNITNHAEKNGLIRADMRLGSPRTFGAVLSLRY
jgi:iron complex outermembrane receptor protein